MPRIQHLDIENLISEIRQRLELTQEQLAHQLGVTCLTVNRWENRHAKPSPMALKLIELKLKQMGERGQDLLERYFTE
ncbi:helix-turn-helix domain-containing protein [Microcoleus sp. FACHB-53]|nr:helix-turn-helix domain-containing protein [Microcoleus sp. FACHB-53]